MDNLVLYNAVREPPNEALKTIGAGRLKGMTDINPMWRIKALTEQFGPCGIGWKYVVKREWMETSPAGEIAAFMDIDLYYKWDGQWSEPVPGTGGSSFVANEKNGPHMSDECYKMALTDAISVACKALGFGADVYWDKDRTKYGAAPSPAAERENKYICSRCGNEITDSVKRDGTPWPKEDIVDYSKRGFSAVLCPNCMRRIVEERRAERNESA